MCGLISNFLNSTVVDCRIVRDIIWCSWTWLYNQCSSWNQTVPVDKCLQLFLEYVRSFQCIDILLNFLWLKRVLRGFWTVDNSHNDPIIESFISLATDCDHNMHYRLIWNIFYCAFNKSFPPSMPCTKTLRDTTNLLVYNTSQGIRSKYRLLWVLLWCGTARF